MRIAPKPKQGQQVSIEELLKGEIPNFVGIINLPDGHQVPNRDAYIIESQSCFTLGPFMYKGKRYLIDVNKKPTSALEPFTTSASFCTANSIEWFWILRKGFELHQDPVYRDTAQRFRSEILHMWGQAEAFGLASTVRMYDPNRHEIRHEGHCWRQVSHGIAIGKTNAQLDNPNYHFSGLTCMLFGEVDVGMVSSVWKHYLGLIPNVVQYERFSHRESRQRFTPWMFQDKIFNKSADPPAKVYLSIRQVEY